MRIYVNGKMIEDTRARVFAADAGFQHAVGLFETLGVYHGRPFRLTDHLCRLERSVRELGLQRQPDPDDWRRAVDQTIYSNQIQRARLRITVTPGVVGPFSAASSATGPTDAKPTVLVQASQPAAYGAACFEQGIMVTIGPPAANPFDRLAGHKTLSYWHRLLTLRQAASLGGGEVIWLNTSNHLASGAVSNLFLVKGREILTPYARGEEVPTALPAPVLPGITRAAVIELAMDMGIGVTRRMLSIADLLDADEAFLTNSGWLLLPVTRVEKKPVGDARVGPVTRRLRTALLDLVDRETQPV